MRAVQKNDFSISRPSPRRRRRRAGFTIIEVMLAASVMALVFSTSIVTLQSAFQSLDTARNVTLAGQIMMTEMEKMRMSDWAAVSAYPAQSTMLTIDPNFTNNPRISNRFTLSRTVTTVGGNAELLQFTYTTAWKGNGRARSRSYSTYYARYGIHDYFYNTL